MLFVFGFFFCRMVWSARNVQGKCLVVFSYCFYWFKSSTLYLLLWDFSGQGTHRNRLFSLILHPNESSSYHSLLGWEELQQKNGQFDVAVLNSNANVAKNGRKTAKFIFIEQKLLSKFFFQKLGFDPFFRPVQNMRRSSRGSDAIGRDVKRFRQTSIHTFLLRRKAVCFLSFSAVSATFFYFFLRFVVNY